ncbi:MAG: hypothetical protein V4717_24480 [Bacteroidota bacterium]
MKKKFSIGSSVCMLLLTTAILVQTACSSSKTAQPSANRKEIKGKWMLDSIRYEGLVPGAKYNIALLDEGASECLAGSTWVLPNNGFGSYTLTSNATGCTPGERKINWSYRTISGETIFQFKKLEEGVKAKNVSEGYRFKIVSADDNAMSLQQEVTSEGKPVYINYAFTSIK